MDFFALDLLFKLKLTFNINKNRFVFVFRSYLF